MTQQQRNKKDPNADPKAPISTEDFLSWVTEEQKRARSRNLKVALVVSIYIAAMSAWSFGTSRYLQYETKLSLSNQTNLIEIQKDVASTRATRANAVTKNEIGICKLVYTLIIRQRRIANLLVQDPVFIEHQYEASFRERRTLLKQLSDDVNTGKLPACDGFPSAPAP